MDYRSELAVDFDGVFAAGLRKRRYRILHLSSQAKLAWRCAGARCVAWDLHRVYVNRGQVRGPVYARRDPSRNGGDVWDLRNHSLYADQARRGAWYCAFGVLWDRDRDADEDPTQRQREPKRPR
ncbi:hypothetical protein D3C81_1407240 [compost metagenome]